MGNADVAFAFFGPEGKGAAVLPFPYAAVQAKAVS